MCFASFHAQGKDYIVSRLLSFDRQKLRRIERTSPGGREVRRRPGQLSVRDEYATKSPALRFQEWPPFNHTPRHRARAMYSVPI